MDAEKVEVAESISTTWLLVCTAVALLVVHQTFRLSYLWRIGIPGPRPYPLIGNWHQFFKGKLLLTLINWSKTYGKTYGFYAGSSSVIMTNDADIARQILIRNFNSFKQSGAFKIPYLCDSILNANEDTWKRGRSYMSPAFSGSKKKQMIPTLNERCDILLELLEKTRTEEEDFDTKKMYASYVIDNVACCAFGIDADCQRNPDNQFIKQVEEIFNPQKRSRFGMIIRVIAPMLAPILDKMGMEMMSREPVDFFASIVEKAMELRKEEPGSERRDFLQLMMEAADLGGEEVETDPSTGNQDGEVSRGTRKKIPLTRDELIGQSLVFFFAGYETVATTLSFASYALAKYPEVQKKVYEEIDEFTCVGEPVDYDAVGKMQYFEKVWCECQRMWPMAMFLKRSCFQDTTVEGLHMANEQSVQIDIWGIHHDPQHYPDPFTFNPENKEAKESRHPCAFLAFGAGPRICVGMRFAVLESKLALIRILQKYRLELKPDAKDLCDPENLGRFGMYPKEGIHLQLVVRDS